MNYKQFVLGMIVATAIINSAYADTKTLSHEEVVKIGTKCVAFGVDVHLVFQDMTLNPAYSKEEDIENFLARKENKECLATIWLTFLKKSSGI